MLRRSVTNNVILVILQLGRLSILQQQTFLELTHLLECVHDIVVRVELHDSSSQDRRRSAVTHVTAARMVIVTTHIAETGQAAPPRSNP
jgi:hypothetical protein